MNRKIGFALSTIVALTLAACGGGTKTSTGSTGGSTGGSGATTGTTGGTGGNTGGTGATGGSTGGTGATGGSTGGTGATGGSTGGTGGTGGSTGGTGGGAMAQCTDAAQCTLVNDCCSCVGISKGETAPPCDIPECFVPTCGSLGLMGDSPACSAGQCVAGFDCDHSKVMCKSTPPTCNPGETPTVQNGCWGSCVPATECATVAKCEQCTGGQTCVQEVTQLGFISHCVALPSACNGKATCECMGGAVCVGAYKACSASATGLQCSCPDC